MADEKPYNPLDKSNLGRSLAEALLATSVQPLPPERFVGAGIYALYYSGDLPLYLPISKRNSHGKWDLPIYVGKAVPEGARKGEYRPDAEPGTALWKRLKEHARSLEECENLSVRHFSCRYLVADDIWIPLGEALLISRFSPLWNVLVDGFGIHTPGVGRLKQQRSMWDTLHPGRKLADGLPLHKRGQLDIERAVRDFLSVKDRTRKK
jgi:hypothetical protein